MEKNKKTMDTAQWQKKSIVKKLEIAHLFISQKNRDIQIKNFKSVREVLISFLKHI